MWRIAFGAPVVPDVHITKATPGSYRRSASRRSTPSARTMAAGSVASSTRATSASGKRGFRGTNTPPASQTAVIVVTTSGPLGSETATADPGPTPRPFSSSASARAVARASPAVTLRSMVNSNPSSSAKGCSINSDASKGSVTAGLYLRGDLPKTQPASED